MAHVHLVRHGEVHNPDHTVYADLPGYELSEAGWVQVERAAEALETEDIAAVWSSPLVRALQTAERIAAHHQLPVRVLPELTEWGLLRRWRGIAWESVPMEFPGELEAYLEDPSHIPNTPEALEDLGARMRGALETALSITPGTIVVVGHQDPIHAAVRELTGLGYTDFHRSKPGHAEVITLDGPPWRLIGRIAVEERP